MPLCILFMSILPLSFDLLCFIALMNQCVPIARNWLFPPPLIGAAKLYNHILSTILLFLWLIMRVKNEVRMLIN